MHAQAHLTRHVLLFVAVPIQDSQDARGLTEDSGGESRDLAEQVVRGS